MFNPTQSNLIDLERSMNDLSTQKALLGNKKKELEIKLSMLKTRVIGNTLPHSEYKDICRKQIEHKKEMLLIEEEIVNIGIQLRKKHDLKSEIVSYLKSQRIENPEEDNNITKKKLITLRDGYIGFSSDITRISSMRAMASKVAGEIEEIIKTL